MLEVVTIEEFEAEFQKTTISQKIKAFKVEKSVEFWEELVERCKRIMSMTEQPKTCTGLRYCPCRREK